MLNFHNPFNKSTNINESNNRITELEMQIKVLKQSLDTAVNMLQQSQKNEALYKSKFQQSQKSEDDQRTEIEGLKRDLDATKSDRDEALQTVQKVALCIGGDAKEADELSNKINNVLIEVKDGVERRKQIQKILNIEKADKQRIDNLNDKKNWLTLITIMISIFSFVASLALSKAFGMNHIFNGYLTIAFSIASIVFGFVKCCLSMWTAKKHFDDNAPFDPEIDADLESIKQKDWAGYVLLMKAISMTIATTNDGLFDLCQGWAAVKGEYYESSILSLLIAATWIGLIEEGIEVIVEIFFTVNEFKFCKPKYYNPFILIFSVLESIIGIISLSVYDTIELQVFGLTMECLILLSVGAAAYIFWKWNSFNPKKGNYDISQHVYNAVKYKIQAEPPSHRNIKSLIVSE